MVEEQFHKISNELEFSPRDKHQREIINIDYTKQIQGNVL